MTEPVFPEDSWVEVRYSLTSEQDTATGTRGRGCPAGWSPGAAHMSGRSAYTLPNWPPGMRARSGTRCVSGTPPRSACPKRRPTWNGLPDPNWRRNERHLEQVRPRARPEAEPTYRDLAA
jgi:hypothetical protein